MKAPGLLGIALSALVGCGGAGAASHDAGSGGTGTASGDASGDDSSAAEGDAGGSSGGGGTSWVGLCPEAPPDAGSPCTAPGLACERALGPGTGYVGNSSPLCDTVAICTANGWETPIPPGPCGFGSCPATYADVTPNGTCNAAPLSCSYTQAQCNCYEIPNSSPVKLEWQCAVPAAGCPLPRPALGSSCSQPGLTCDYGACTGGSEQSCLNGVWFLDDPTCSPPGAG